MFLLRQDKWPEEYLILWAHPSGQLAGSQALTNIESSKKGRFPYFFSLHCCVGTLLTFLQSISIGDAFLFSFFTKKNQNLIIKSPTDLLLDFFLHMDK